MGKVWLKGHWYKVEYEGLHLIYASCGYYGQMARSCPSQPVAAPGGECAQEARTGEERNTSEISATKLGEENVGSSPHKEGPKNMETDLHGGWMIMARKKKGIPSLAKIIPKRGLSVSGVTNLKGLGIM